MNERQAVERLDERDRFGRDRSRGSRERSVRVSRFDDQPQREVRMTNVSPGAAPGGGGPGMQDPLNTMQNAIAMQQRQQQVNGRDFLRVGKGRKHGLVLAYRLQMQQQVNEIGCYF